MRDYVFLENKTLSPYFGRVRLLYPLVGIKYFFKTQGYEMKAKAMKCHCGA